MADLRRNVRASLRREVVVRGNDGLGRPFALMAQSVDFSRKGLGLVVSDALLTPGMSISLSSPGRFQSQGTVQWSRPGADGRVRVGVSLRNPQVSTGLRVAAALLLALALVGQASYSRPRASFKPRGNTGCGVTVEEMKSRVSDVLGPLATIGASEKAFLHVQHEHMGCDGYTKMFEESAFFADPAIREALKRWHWEAYHSADVATQNEAVHSAELAIGVAR